MRTITLQLALTLLFLTTGGCSYDSDSGDGTVSAGTLTAGAWDDNLNFDFFKAYAADLEAQQLTGLPPFTAAERDTAHTRSDEARSARQALDIALVIDTTSSMSDELSYLQTEFDALASTIAAQYPGAQQRWGLVTYRDDGSAYVTRHEAFTTDVNAFQRSLGRANANGGGDYPEAADEGLAEAMSLDWSTGASARLLFWVADAPHHDGRADALADAVREAAASDVHIYPVASSGVDELTEYAMRASAQLTLGRYLFLTSDSGVGGEHQEPTVPCYFVTRLDHAIERMVHIEMSGVYREPTADELVRTGGDPTDGRCTLQDERVVLAF